MRKVMIATPCYDGRLDVWYTNSLVDTIELNRELNYGLEIRPLWVSFDALVQRARNDIIDVAYNSGFDDVVWIDSDIEWKPEWFFKLLEYDVDIVGGTYPKKGDIEEYVVKKTNNIPKNIQTGLLEVDGLGTGFVRMNRKSIEYLWNNSKPYIDPKDNRERRMVFDVIITDYNVLMSEDIYMFDVLKKGGFKIWLDPKMTCNHTGPKKFTGNFERWYSRVKKQL